MSTTPIIFFCETPDLATSAPSAAGGYDVSASVFRGIAS